MADSKVDLGAGAPEGYSFGIAGYGVRPRVFVEGRQTGRTPSVDLPEGDVLLDISNQNYYGKIGVDVTSPGGDTFGGAASGSYYRGSVDYPEELQRYGAPDREAYSARGIQSPEYSGYYQMKDGPRFEGYYRDMPEGSDMPDEYGGRVSYTIPFEDGGEVEKPMGIEKSVTISKVVPYVDPRSAALGSRLLKQAGVPGDFASLMQSADPKVVEQVNRIMARGPANEISSPSNGLGVFMQSVMSQG